MRTDNRSSYLIHGLRIRSEVPLEGVTLETTPDEIDLEIEVVDLIPAATAGAKDVLSYDFGDGKVVHATLEDDGSTLVSFSDTCRFRISPCHDRIAMSVLDPAQDELASILLQGWVMAMTLMLRGEIVLHATAIETDRGSIALLADSGMGKSTVAALLIRDGAQLVADDVLRIQRDDSLQWAAHPGITALRLRPAARGLAESLTDSLLRVTTDGRVSAGFTRQSGRPVKLIAVLLPLPSPEATEVGIDWLEPMAATAELNRYPRVYDWMDVAPVRRHFHATSVMAADIPVGALTIPWGPPWPTNVLRDVLQLLPTV